jgi:hypothetical protein
MQSLIRVRINKNPNRFVNKRIQLTRTELTHGLQYVASYLTESEIEAYVNNYDISAKIITMPSHVTYNNKININPFTLCIYDIVSNDLNFPLEARYGIFLLKDKIKNYRYQLEILVWTSPNSDQYKLHIVDAPFQKFLIDNKMQFRDLRENNNSKYRLFIDEKMVIERIFPSDINIDQSIEEILFVNLEKGQHIFKIETIEGDKVFMHDLAIDEQIYYIGSDYGEVKLN